MLRAKCIKYINKNLNARKHDSEYPEAVTAILKKYYMDDYLASFDTEKEAIKVSLDVKGAHARGRFEIINWHLNLLTLMKRDREPVRRLTKSISIDAENHAERTLGLHCAIPMDCLLVE